MSVKINLNNLYITYCVYYKTRSGALSHLLLFIMPHIPHPLNTNLLKKVNILPLYFIPRYKASATNISDVNQMQAS